MTRFCSLEGSRSRPHWLWSTVLGLPLMTSLGCGGGVVTDAPLSAEELRELDEQRQLIERQFAPTLKARQPG